MPEQEVSTFRSSTDPRKRGRFVAYSVAAVVASLGSVVVATVILASSSSAREDGAPGAAGPATGFILLPEFHATLFVSPGVTGENSIDVVFARHDGSEAAGISDVTVSVSQPLDGTRLRDFHARPVPGSPGTFRVSGLSIPSAGDREFGISVNAEGAEPVSNTTLIPIGAPSNGN